MKKIKIKAKKKKNSSGKKLNTNFASFKEKWKKGNLAEKILVIIMFILVGIFAIGISFLLYIVIMAPEFDVEKLYTKEASIIYDSSGNEIARLGTENRQRVSYDDIPEVFVDALVATEDSRFFQHNGVDLARFIKATLGQLLGHSGAGGASTLTMQIVKQRITSSESSGIEGIIRKFTDMYISVFKIEKKYTKEQIIEYYVNIPGLGSNTFGIQQASEKYFDKSISEVTLPEAALLAGLFQAPSAYNPYNYPEKAEQRRNQVLNLMQRHGYITKEECENAKKISVTSLLANKAAANNPNQGFINTVIDEVESRTGKNPYLVSMKIYSTMVQEKQDVINDIYNGVTYKWPNDYLQAGIVVTDVKTGAMVAVGASRKKGERTYNYATDIKVHPGSSAKPIFDYGPAIEYLNWSTGQMVIDDEYTYSNGVKIKNWDNGYKGIMTIRTALASSRNIPALQAFQAVPQDKIDKFVTGLGITPQYEGDHFINESHSIGGFEGTNPKQMSAAYGAFARGGVYIEPYSITKIEFVESGEVYTVTPEKRTVMSEATAYMISMILKTAVTDGYVSAGSKSGTDICSKTGTSTVDASVKKANNIKKAIIGNSWQVTYSPDYVYAIWVGVDKITPTQYLTSSMGGSAKKAMTKLLTSKINNSNSRFKQPSTVTTATVELETNPIQLASEYTPSNLKRVEYFKVKTVPEDVSSRFSQLSNPTNLKVSVTPIVNHAELTWTAIPTPDAISESYLKEYFNNGYSVWADKYYQKRLTYNKSNIGSIGYHVYVDNGNGYTDLGFTTKTSYTYTGTVNSNTKFMVKSSYSIFKANKSSGVEVSVNSSSNEPSNPSTDWTASLNGAAKITVAAFYKFFNNNNLVKVISGGKVVNAKVTTTCFDSDGDEVNCKTLDCKQSYDVQHTISYNNKTKTISRTLTAGC